MFYNLLKSTGIFPLDVRSFRCGLKNSIGIRRYWSISFGSIQISQYQKKTHKCYCSVNGINWCCIWLLQKANHRAIILDPGNERILPAHESTCSPSVMFLFQLLMNALYRKPCMAAECIQKGFLNNITVNGTGVSKN